MPRRSDEMSKFTLLLTEKQEKLLDSLQEPLGATSRADVIRKALALAVFVADVKEKNQQLAIAGPDGKVVERVHLI